MDKYFQEPLVKSQGQSYHIGEYRDPEICKKGWQNIIPAASETLKFMSLAHTSFPDETAARSTK